MIEEWRDVVGYEGWYQASNFGNIRSLSREVSGKSRHGNCIHTQSRMQGGSEPH